jgi:sec-independent protein translocase protein TatA
MNPPILPLAWHPGTWEMLIMLLVILLVFGSRLPKVARSLGQGINEFKKGLAESSKDDAGSDEKEAPKAEAPKAEPSKS